MILCCDLKEILPRAGSFKNVLESLSNYFNRRLTGKHWAVEEKTKGHRLDVLVTLGILALAVLMRGFVFTAGSEHQCFSLCREAGLAASHI